MIEEIAAVVTIAIVLGSFEDLVDSVTSYFEEINGVVGVLIVLLAAWLLMGCVAQTTEQLCAGTTCANYTHSVSVNATGVPPIPSIPAEATPSPLPSPFTAPSPLLELYGSADNIELGGAMTANGNFDFGPNSDELERAEVTLSEDGAQLAGYNYSNGAGGTAFAVPEYAVAGERVGNHELELSAQVFYLNGSLYGNLSQLFHFTVQPLEYYQNEHSAYNVNASSKAAQSFTLENAAEVTRIGVYGLKKSDAALLIELCPDASGAPGPTLYWNNQDDSGVPAQPAWFSLGLNATLQPGKYWIIVTDQGSFDWFSDLYGENNASDSIYRYGGEWLNQTRDKFFKVA